MMGTFCIMVINYIHYISNHKFIWNKFQKMRHKKLLMAFWYNMLLPDGCVYVLIFVGVSNLLYNILCKGIYHLWFIYEASFSFYHHEYMYWIRIKLLLNLRLELGPLQLHLVINFRRLFVIFSRTSFRLGWAHVNHHFLLLYLSHQQIKLKLCPYST